MDDPSRGCNPARRPETTTVSEWVNLWYPERGQSSRTAKKICLNCPVRLECVSHASMISERFGIWGGLQVNERRQR